MARILIVDDDVDAGEGIAALLRAAGHTDVRVTTSGTAALALAGEFVPAVVLMDLDLPDVDAYDVARLLSQHPDLQNLRIIALTKGGKHPAREHARESGFQRYLLKPVSGVALAELLPREVS
jgi:CheY-like chemotaxis protein